MEKLFWDNLVWVLPLVIFVASYITGDLLQIIFKIRRGIASKVLTGFLVLLCLFHLTSLPFMYNAWPFSSLYWLFICEFIAVLITYVVMSFVRNTWPVKDDALNLYRSAVYTAKHNWWYYIIWVAAIALIIWQISNIILHINFNVDDNFYVAESVMNLTRNQMMDSLPSSGIEGSVFPNTYLLVSWEAFISFLAKLFRVHPATLCHSILPATLLPLHYMAYYLAGREFGRKRVPIFMLFVAILNIVCGPCTYSQGSFLTLRIWQGKSVLVNIIFPILLYVFIRIVKDKKASWRNLAFLFVILLGSQAASTVGTYLTPVLYAVYAIAFLVIVKNWKEFFKLFIPAIAIAPFVLWKILLLSSNGSLQSLSEGSGVNSKSFYDIFTKYFGWNLAPILLIIAIVILTLLLKNNEDAKDLRWFFLISIGALIILFINPLTFPYVERFITGVGVYWRMFWLLQTTFIVAIGFGELCMIPKQTLVKASVVALLCVIFIISGKNIFKDEDYKEDGFKNTYKVSETVRKMANKIEKQIKEDNKKISEEELNKLERDTIVLMPRTLAQELRQYKDISLIYYIYLSNNYKFYTTDEVYNQIYHIYNALYRFRVWTKEDMLKDVTDLGIDYVAIGSGTYEKNLDNIPEGFELIHDGSRYVLLKTNIK